MPLTILRQDIANMRFDAKGTVLDPVLPRFGWRGKKGRLYTAYRNSLKYAARQRYESVALPLIELGSGGPSKEEALRVATKAIGRFLANHPMDVFLCVADEKEHANRETLLDKVSGYLHANYQDEDWRDSPVAAMPLSRGDSSKTYGAASRTDADLDGLWSDGMDQGYAPPDSVDADMPPRAIRFHAIPKADRSYAAPNPPPPTMAAPSVSSLKRHIDNLDEPFSAALLRLIDAKGKSDVEVYKRANLDRKLFSKIRKGLGYTPSKRTAIALAVALELSLEETDALLKRAGYTLSHSQKFDVIVEYFILKRRYDLYEINEILFQYDQPLLGG